MKRNIKLYSKKVNRKLKTKKYKNNKNKNKTFKKGGMFRWRMKKTNKVAPIEFSNITKNQVVPFDPSIHNDLPQAETIPLAEASIDNSKKASPFEIYNDIKNNGFPRSIDQLISLMDEYPNFYVNYIDSNNETITDLIIDECVTKFKTNPNISNDKEINELINKIKASSNYNNDTKMNISKRYQELLEKNKRETRKNKLLINVLSQFS